MLKVLLCLLLVASSQMSLSKDLGEGKLAPLFEATTIKGEKLNLAEQAGKTVIIHYWATWCPTCREEIPIFNAYYKKHQKDNLVMIFVSIDDASDISKVKEMTKSYEFPIAMDQDTNAKGYGRIWRIPLTFIIDKKGILRKNAWFDDGNINEAVLEKNITPLLQD
jgi:cytochrome c biogenesis protein CcmG, thiol:disulfide interchange protein DsbE